VETIGEIPHIRKIEGYESYYRIKIGDYRLGMESVSNRKVINAILKKEMDLLQKIG
jgi:mRNA interferase RelE/StbE